MPSSVIGGLALVLGLCLCPHVGHAQQPDTSQQQLPEIAPQEFEIRGELQLSFPSLERQPLRGFASPPTVPTVPADRTPYVAPYKQALEDLPESLPAPESTTQSVQQTAEAQRGFVEAGGGRYASRFAAGRYAFDVSPHQTLSVHANYRGTEGFSPFDGASGLDTPADAVEGGLQFDSRHDGFSVRAAAHGQAQDYTLYGQPGVASASAPEAPSRTGAGGGAQAHLRTHGSIRSQVDLGYTRSSYGTEPSGSASSSETFAEGRLALDGRVAVPIGGTDTYAELGLVRSSYSGDVPSSASGYSVDGGAGTRVWEQSALSVQAGVRVLSYSAPRDPNTASDATADGTYILPSVRAELELSSGVTAFAENAPTLRSPGLDGLYATNPYAEHAPSVRPTVFTTNAGAGLSASLGPVRLQADAGFRYAPSYRAFSSPTTAGMLDDVPIQVGYGSARILHGGGQVALQGVEGVEASLEMSVRDGELVGADAAIPYFSPVVTRAMVSVSFLDDKALLQTSGTIESPRPLNTTSDREVGTYTSFTVEGSYEVTSLLDALLRIENLSPDAPTRWARYSQPPTAVQAGLRIRW